jgi:hypothetical protein
MFYENRIAYFKDLLKNKIILNVFYFLVFEIHEIMFEVRIEQKEENIYHRILTFIDVLENMSLQKSVISIKKDNKYKDYKVRLYLNLKNKYLIENFIDYLITFTKYFSKKNNKKIKIYFYENVIKLKIQDCLCFFDYSDEMLDYIFEFDILLKINEGFILKEILIYFIKYLQLPYKIIKKK